MRRTGFLRKFLSIGEKLVMNQLVDFTEMAIRASTLLQEILLSGPEEVRIKNNEIMHFEKRADELNRRLKQEITEGAIASNLMDNFIVLVDKCDDILDKAYFLSREIKRMKDYLQKTRNESSEIVRKSYERFHIMLEKNKIALSLVEVMLKTTDMKVMKDTRLNIELMEEDVDELEDNIIDEIYMRGDYLPYIVFSHLRDTVRKIDDMLDDCEDIADLIQTISLAIVR